MLRPHGYATISDPDVPLLERDTITCAHCQLIVHVKPGTGSTVYLLPQLVPGSNVIIHREEAGAFCRKCMKAVCLKCHAHGRCLPSELLIEAMERRIKNRLGWGRFFRFIGIGE